MKVIKEIIDKIEFTYKIGQNRDENVDALDHADPEDYWFHWKDGPSCFVIMTNPENGFKNKKTKRKAYKKGSLLVKENTNSLKVVQSLPLEITIAKVKDIEKQHITGQVLVKQQLTDFII